MPLDLQIIESVKELKSVTRNLENLKLTKDNDANLTAPDLSLKDENQEEISEEEIENFSVKLSELCNELSLKNQNFMAFKILKIVQWPLILQDQIREQMKKLHDGFTVVTDQFHAAAILFRKIFDF